MRKEKIKTKLLNSLIVFVSVILVMSIPGCSSKLPDVREEISTPAAQSDVIVPDTTGQSIDDATNNLQQQGFEVSVDKEFSDSIKNGEVISQSPSGGSLLQEGGNVTLVVSQGILEVFAENSSTRTIMIYIVGSDLETNAGLATGDLIEILESDFNQDFLNVLVCTGGASVWNNDVIPNDKNMIYEIIGNGMLPVRASPAQNMGDSKTLADFLSFCYKNYSSDYYDLILWNHGSGPMMGFGYDEIFNDILSLEDIIDAMKHSPFSRGNKLGFVGFDACLMSSIEVAYAFYEYAEYLIASQEIIPGWGWDYAFLGNLEQKMSTAEIAVEIIDTYFDFSE